MELITDISFYLIFILMLGFTLLITDHKGLKRKIENLKNKRE